MDPAGLSHNCGVPRQQTKSKVDGVAIWNLDQGQGPKHAHPHNPDQDPPTDRNTETFFPIGQ